MGLYADGSSSGFGMRTSLPVFRFRGKQPSAKHLLYAYTKRSGNALKATFSISLLIPSGPGALLLGSDLAANATSPAEQNGSWSARDLAVSADPRGGAVGKNPLTMPSSLPGSSIPVMGVGISS